MDRRARDVTTCRRGQEHGSPADVVAGSPAERELLAVIVVANNEPCIARRWQTVGGNGVHPDALHAEFEGQRATEMFDRCLHGSVDTESGSRPIGLDRGDVDDRRTRTHARHGGPHKVGDAGEVLIDQRALTLVAGIEKGSVEGAASVVDEHINAIEAVDPLVHRSGIANIEDLGDHVGSKCSSRLRCVGEFVDLAVA